MSWVSECSKIRNFPQNNKTLIELLLSYNEIGSEGAIELSGAVASNDILEVLDLSWNRIRGEGAEELAKGLKENIRIKVTALFSLNPWC